MADERKEERNSSALVCLLRAFIITLAEIGFLLGWVDSSHSRKVETIFLSLIVVYLVTVSVNVLHCRSHNMTALGGQLLQTCLG